MRRLASILFTLALTGCSQATLEFNHEYVKNLMDKIKVGELHSDITSKLADISDEKQQIWNLCSKTFEAKPTQCFKGYSLIAVIPLPKQHWWLNEGTGQLYFTFNSNLELTAHHYEIYYPKYHQ